MSNLVWPSSLPQRPTVGGYQERFAETVLRTAMDAGAAKLRRRFTAAPRQIELTFRMTAAQVAVLRSFYEETTGGGALPFDWVHPREGGVAECPSSEQSGRFEVAFNGGFGASGFAV
ncbi:MAG: hypothetical protein ACK5XB_21435 [Rhodospirillales bacterium]|jgi:hypothetical protein